MHALRRNCDTTNQHSNSILRSTFEHDVAEESEPLEWWTYGQRRNKSPRATQLRHVRPFALRPRICLSGLRQRTKSLPKRKCRDIVRRRNLAVGSSRLGCRLRIGLRRMRPALSQLPQTVDVAPKRCSVQTNCHVFCPSLAVRGFRSAELIVRPHSPWCGRGRKKSKVK